MPDPKTAKPEDIELHADAWARFERFVKTSARTAKPPAPVAKKATKKRSKAARKT